MKGDTWKQVLTGTMPDEGEGRDGVMSLQTKGCQGHLQTSRGWGEAGGGANPTSQSWGVRGNPPS